MSNFKPKGNPNWRKGKSGNPNGRPKGSFNLKKLLRVESVLASVKHNRHPVDELIYLADEARAQGKHDLAADIWRDLLKYCEPQKRPVECLPERSQTPEDSLEAAEAAMKMIKDLENGTSGKDTSTDTGNPPSLEVGKAEVPPEASPAQDVPGDEQEGGPDHGSELLPASGEELHDSGSGDRDSNPVS